MLCDHPLWLEITDEGSSRTVRQSRRLRTLNSRLPSPAHQHPALALFFESRERVYFPAHENGGIYLRLDPGSQRTSQPLLIGSGRLLQSYFPPKQRAGSSRCCSVLQEASFPHDEISLHAAILPFVDVISYHCITVGDILNAEAQLYVWLAAWKGSHAELPKPRFVVRLADDYPSLPQTIKRSLLQRLPLLGQSLTVVKLGSATWATHGLQPICERLVPVIERSRRDRRRRKTTFSGYHTQQLVEQSLAWSLQAARRNFSYVEAARAYNPVAPDLAAHLGEFLTSRPDCADEFVAETIASSFLLDHLTDRMHAFHIRDVFYALYSSSCRAHEGAAGFPGSAAILDCMELLEPPRLSTGFNVVERHRAILAKHRESWRRVKGSHATCFVCHRRRPELRPECGHIVCAHCVKRFGERLSKRARCVTLSQCLLCASPCLLTVIDHPPTDGVGLLCLDGGGVRGIVQTVILALIEQDIGLPIPVQEYFQLVGGVSAGGLNVISLFLMGWAATKCTAMYETIAETIFQRSMWHRVPLVSVVATVLGSALYSAKLIEQAISDAYGTTAKMLDASYASTIGTKVLLPVATSPDPSLLLFTNYNGVGDASARTGERDYQKPHTAVLMCRRLQGVQQLRRRVCCRCVSLPLPGTCQGSLTYLQRSKLHCGTNVGVLK